MPRPKKDQTDHLVASNLLSPIALTDVVRYFLNAPVQEVQTAMTVAQAIVAHRWKATMAAVVPDLPGPVLVVEHTVKSEVAAPRSVPAVAPTAAAPSVQALPVVPAAPRRRRVGRPPVATAPDVATVASGSIGEEDVPLPGMAPADLPPQDAGDQEDQ